MICRIIISLFILITFCSCSLNEKKILLLDSSEGKYEYISHHKYGNEVKVIIKSDGQVFFYSLKIKNDGHPIHLIKHPYSKHQKHRAGIDYYRNMSIAVTDTSIVWEPKYFNYSILGYYDDTSLINDIINKSKIKFNIYSLNNNEKRMIFVVDSLMKKSNIQYKLDTSKIIGWYKFIF